MRMPNRILHLTLIISFVMVVAEGGPSGSPCEKPIEFQNLQVLHEYIDCVKYLQFSRYGKRSDTTPNIPKKYRSAPNFYKPLSQANHEETLFELLKRYNN